MKLHHHGHNKTTSVGHRSQQCAGRFLCFKPTGVEYEHLKDKPLFYKDKEIKIDSNGEKASKRKGFSRALKEILLRSKSRKKSSENGEEDGICSFRFGKRSQVSESENGLTKSSSIRSTSSSRSSSSSCLSSDPSESPTMSKISSSSNPINPKPPKQSSLEQRQRVFGRPMVMGVVLIVISLTLTIFWGRLLAIGLNAVWLCSIPKQGRSRSKRRLTALSFIKTTSLQRSFDSELAWWSKRGE